MRLGALADDDYKNTHTFDVNWEDSDKADMVFFGSNDGIVLGVDGDHSGGPGYDNDELARFVEVSGETQLYEAISRTPAGPTLDDIRSRYWGADFSWMTLHPYAEAGVRVAGETPVIWSIELYITVFRPQGGGVDQTPRKRVASALSAGEIIGFAMGVYDFVSGRGSAVHLQLVPEALADPRSWSCPGHIEFSRRFLSRRAAAAGQPDRTVEITARSSRFHGGESRPRSRWSSPIFSRCTMPRPAQE